MLYIFFALVVIGFAAVFFIIIQQSSVNSVPSNKKLPYVKTEFLLTKAERSFYEVLLVATRNSNFHVFPKIRIADLLYLPKGTTDSVGHRNKIQSKHVDFVICDTLNIKPLVIIELDDSSHKQDKRVKRDEFVDRAFNDAGLPLLRIPVKHTYSVSELSVLINNRLSPKSEVAAAKRQLSSLTSK